MAGVAVALAAPAGAGAAKPVPSLQPQATATLWHKLVQRRHAVASTQDCTSPLRLVFYSPTDWLRLATKLAANQSPCAQYSIAIPPLAADKTNFRPDQPWRIRALGPNFHAAAEISYNGWASWVTTNNSTWYAAGVEARKRMAAQGYDLAAGDTWAVNESSSAVRTGTGAARQNLRDLVRGLYDAGGTGPPVKGAVFVVGVGQGATNLTTYKGTLQLWYADTPFWTDMSAYVSDWSQEVYGDVRNYAVPGAPVETRRAELSAWLEHPLMLANSGPATDIAPAQSFLQTTYSPLANAAWPYSSGFGWTDVPYDQMQDYVSAQAYALGSAGTRFGFAWSPNRPDAMSITEFANESGAVAERLAAAIHDTASACASSCINAIPGAAFNEGWNDFSTWSAPTLVFANQVATASAGAATGPLTVRLQVAGTTRPATQPVTVTLTSSSLQGTFSVSPSGPWTSSLGVQVPVGATDAVFYYRDTKAGTATISAAAPGRAGIQQIVSVKPGSLATLSVTPAAASLRAGQVVRLSASGADAYGNKIAVSPTWRATSGTVSPRSGARTTFTAGKPGTATITASTGTRMGGATVKVARTARVGRISYAVTRGRLLVALKIVDWSTHRVPHASVRFALRRNGRWFAAASVRADSHGLATFSRPVPRGCYSVKIARVTAKGFQWNRATPKNGVCVS